MIRVYISLGSNLAQPLQQITSALKALANLPCSELIKCSPFYRSKPLGSQEQPDYLNAVVAVDTLLSAEKLLDYTQAIELQQGRVRKEQRWGARTLDLDIMLYGDHIINSERLVVPHYGLKEREFMLYPLADIASGLIFPDGESLAENLTRITKNGLMLWK
ncbi:2-amino-4-hydroxy-6-hydroxymethyldihydropteridine diphosphokinase [Candidatus Fukatsuia symbiotica]|uniref:2-amino-4-hydroxy-6-hydroxymethyldihydropteridine pyrophosphokinase n=1 Tax=Candidatus Fukatsuia symbiotica TaxID=1878942 RepID=A0A2U8I525_9GAMM|nr:2-amino-4-hydroxy-6-hydroxymethyldihydropteridine diphosphokinase [Candidatus Fukatsuia symbiotica]AWK14266.1 2-amino-4-hydroxy-6-hydroxymethyldihydropteridine diphosphokinase [Candidatus Fukatsuia symbiotica]MEA9444515.1 2-amino-4-hydroxy-6-hydroxymethyldihydropteridine diphosphokinase [Candidatus Fukatsuia symbiotica]